MTVGGPHPPRRTPGAAERGSATVLLLALVAVALTLAVAAVAIGRAAHSRGSAQTAADLGAIAAAEAIQRGADGCAVAALVVRANGAEMITCAALAGGDVLVSTAVAVEPLAGWHTSAAASARAGPAR